LYAKKSGGKFLIRIEDTDKKREVSGAENYIIESLKWCGIEADQEPCRQSERKDIYNEHILTLLKEGKAYYAFDTEEELLKLRENEESKGKAFIYNWRNRNSLNNSLCLGEKEVQKKIENKEKYVVRFRCPSEAEVNTHDIIRGDSSIDSSLLDDKILVKADGMPTYHFANVVDDYLMGITHVIRGEEWLPSLALHTLLYEAFAWTSPKYAHLPLILNPNGKGKLSKRSGGKNGFPVFPIRWKGEKEILGFKEIGILPEALINYISTLGWTPDETKEILSLKDLKELFSLEKVVSSSANFDFEKLKWYNHQHIQKIQNDELLRVLLNTKKEDDYDVVKLENAIGLVKERANTVNELWELSRYLFVGPKSYDEKSLKRILKPGGKEIVETIISMAGSESGRADSFVDRVKKSCVDKGFSAGQVMMTVRVVLVGALNGIGLQEIVSFIGIEETSSRAKEALLKIF
jgi:glutamyl-tRNA synthetase